MTAGRADLVVVVHHDKPVGQGNLSKGLHGKSYHSNGKALRPWRAAVKVAATRAMCGRPPMTGPVVLEVTVTVPKPKSAPRSRMSWPITRYFGDWDHLGRAVSDALTEAGVWLDDSQVVDGRVRKVFPGEGEHALARPGAYVEVWAVRPPATAQDALDFDSAAAS
jgi:crossover junction endodeoxyribonuclease RusA